MESKNQSALKHLLIVANFRYAKMYRAKGRKINYLFTHLENKAAGSHEPISRHQGLAQPPLGISPHFYDPSTAVKTSEKQLFAREIAHEITRLIDNPINKLDDCIVVAEPSMLGLIRKDLKLYGHVPISKSFAADIVHLPIKELQEKIFT